MKTLMIAAITAGVLAAGTASPAAAQEAPRAAQHRFASCLYSRYPTEAGALVNATDAQGSASAYNAVTSETVCAERTFGASYSPEDVFLPAGLLRGMLAEAALSKATASAAALPALPLEQKPYVRAWAAASGRVAQLDEMATCIADTDPAAIVALVRTDPDSSGEGAAFANLGSDFHRCLAAGTQLQSKPEWIRAALADALYQRVRVPQLSMQDAGAK